MTTSVAHREVTRCLPRVRGGRIFSAPHDWCIVQHPTHHLRLDCAFHNDLLWWKVFLPSWKGCSFFYNDDWISSSRLKLYTDAFHAGFGPYFSGEWLYGFFQEHDIPLSYSIVFKDLYAIAIAVHTWSSELSSRNIHFTATTPRWCMPYLMVQAGADPTSV